MIKPHQFIGLAGATAVSVVLAAGLWLGSNNWATGKLEGVPFLPELARQINDVGAIEVTQGGRTLVIERSGQDWKLRDRDGFPAKAETARSLVVALAQAQLVEPRTAVAEKLALLELEDPAGKDAKSRRVRTLDATGKVISDAIIGKTRFEAFGSGRGGMYVRRANETQSWLATGDPRVSAELRDWIETRVFSGETAKITRVTIESPGEAPLIVEKVPPAPKEEPKEAADTPPASAPPAPPAPQSKYHIANLAEGMKLKQDAKVDEIVDGFAAINLEDVRKLGATPTGDKVQVIKVESEGGLEVTFHLREDGEERWLSFAAMADEGETKAKADEINATAQGWEFRIPKWKADQIGKRHADLLETS